MARMIPDRPGDDSSGQEKRLFQRLARELPDDCVVLHSLGLPRHQYKLWGEGDFVVLSKFGIFVIEEKGGGISCRNGVWTYTRASDGRVTTSREGPFEQAKSAMFAIRDEVKKKRPDLGNLLFGFGVIMPNEAFDAAGCELEPKILLNRDEYRATRLDAFITDLSEHWTGKHQDSRGGAAPDLLQKQEIQAVQQLLRPDVVSVFTLNTTLCQAEEEQVRLTDEQMKVLTGMQGYPRNIVRGAAGTGKTLLALELARRCAESMKAPVLLLCFNRLLARHINEAVQRHYTKLPIRACSIHDWFREMIKAAGMLDRLDNRPADDEEFYNEHFPTIAMDAIVEVTPEPLECVVIDESQDLLRPLFLDAIDLVLRQGLADGNWHMFLDHQQCIYDGVDKRELTRLQGFRPREHSLWLNCRNTERVATQTSIISSIDVALDSAVDGGFAEVEFVTSPAHAAERVGRRIEKLRKDGVPRDQIIILSGSRLEKSCLAGSDRVGGCRVRDVSEDSDVRGDCIDFCTMHSFKGLERRVVIAVDLQELEAPRRRVLHYCGLSRARTGLVAFLSEGERPAFDRFAQEFGRRRAAAASSQRPITSL